MLCFELSVQAAIRSPAATPTIGFALVRIAELLDPAAPIGVSAAFLVDSQLVVSELVSRLEDYADPGSRYGYVQVERAVRDATRVLRRDPSLRAFYGEAFEAVAGDLGTAERIRRRDVRVRDRSVPFARLMDSSLLASVTRLDTLMGAAPDYRSRIRERVVTTLVAGCARPGDWNRLDGDLRRLCAGLLTLRRHGPSIVAELAAALSSVGDPTDAIDAWTETFTGAARPFEVVVLVDGMKSRAKPAADGFTDLDSLRPSWLRGSEQHNARLRELLDSAIPANGMALHTEVVAADPGQAHQRALDRAELIATRVLHEHRIGDVDILRQAIVFDPRIQSVALLPARRSVIERARVSDRGHLTSLLSALHYFGIARRDARALSSIVNLWTALESLSKGDEQTETVGSFVPKHLDPIVHLVAMRQVFSHSRWLLQRELSHDDRSDPHRLVRWLGRIDSRGLRRWSEVLTRLTDADERRAAELSNASTADDAADALKALLIHCSLHVRRRIESTAEMASDPRRLFAHLDEIGELASLHGDRLRVVRNRTVHNSVVNDTTAEPLRQAGLLLVDAVFELLPYWTRPDEQPHVAMHRALVWRGNLRARWNQGERFSPNAIVMNA